MYIMLNKLFRYIPLRLMWLNIGLHY